jgi:predicted Fe-S protein YdhL (DUF1289 family)
MLDPETRLCLGCWRTPGEIVEWKRLSERKRRAVLAQLPGRRAAGP